MQCIKVPKLIDFEDYQKLPPKEREQYVIFIIKEILKLNKNRGVTIKQIEEKTYFHRNTIAYHLERLIATGEAYNYPPNAKNSFYFPNGNLADPILQENIVLENKIYSIYLMSNQLGKFIYLQEKEIGIDGVVEIKGGIMIPYSERKKFFDGIKEIEKILDAYIVEVKE